MVQEPYAKHCPCSCNVKQQNHPFERAQVLASTLFLAIDRAAYDDLEGYNRVMWNHRAMASVLGVILKLPPIKQAMASRQMKSRYLEYLITHVHV